MYIHVTFLSVNHNFDSKAAIQAYFVLLLLSVVSLLLGTVEIKKKLLTGGIKEFQDK